MAFLSQGGADAASASAKPACTDGKEDVRRERALIPFGRKSIRMIRCIRTRSHGRHGRDGMNQESRHTGAEVELCIVQRNATAMSSTKEARYRNAFSLPCRCFRMDISDVA